MPISYLPSPFRKVTKSNIQSIRNHWMQWSYEEWKHAKGSNNGSHTPHLLWLNWSLLRCIATKVQFFVYLFIPNIVAYYWFLFVPLNMKIAEKINEKWRKKSSGKSAADTRTMDHKMQLIGVFFLFFVRLLAVAHVLLWITFPWIVSMGEKRLLRDWIRTKTMKWKNHIHKLI